MRHCDVVINLGSVATRLSLYVGLHAGLEASACWNHREDDSVCFSVQLDTVVAQGQARRSNEKTSRSVESYIMKFLEVLEFYFS